MFKDFQFILKYLFQVTRLDESFAQYRDHPQFQSPSEEVGDTYRALNAAFLLSLDGEDEPGHTEAMAFLGRMANLPDWEEVALFYLKGIDLIQAEIASIGEQDSQVTRRLRSLVAWIEDQQSGVEPFIAAEKFWSLFHPEATGIWTQQERQVNALRDRRRVTITELNSNPIQDPACQILFTANALLTLPPDRQSIETIPLGESDRRKLADVFDEPQRFWYDHPIQVGVEPSKNEVIYGLRGLQRAVEFERKRGNMRSAHRLTCLLSVSVTHDGLHGLARNYLAREVARAGSTPDLDVYAFTETDAEKIIDQILAPAAGHYLGQADAADLLKVFGVDGEYGRHYTFLKAVAAFWQVLIDPQIEATFKIDLDQVFPQGELLAGTGLSALEHFKTPLWGARGLDQDNEVVELGMIAGALVNESDIERSLFTPDVPFPPSKRKFSPDEYVFFSQLPQALSTAAEMMARYNTPELDGKRTCLQRVHVTGGTNGILIRHLRQHKPFTPSFIGRAEDQAFIFSTFPQEGSQFGYLHKDGLLMRHDKTAFAQEAIQAAEVGKLVGDYVRILYFSAYAQALEQDVHAIKARVDPFTGSFISHIPITLTYLRLALKAESFFKSGDMDLGVEFIRLAAKRIQGAIDFAFGETAALKRRYEYEHQGWDLYYNTLAAIENGVKAGDEFALDLRRTAQDLVKRSAL